MQQLASYRTCSLLYLPELNSQGLPDLLSFWRTQKQTRSSEMKCDFLSLFIYLTMTMDQLRKDTKPRRGGDEASDKKGSIISEMGRHPGSTCTREAGTSNRIINGQQEACYWKGTLSPLLRRAQPGRGWEAVMESSLATWRARHRDFSLVTP